MSFTNKINRWSVLALFPIAMVACKKDTMPTATQETITITNVLNSKALVESGTFQGVGSPAVILPGQSVSFSFAAAKGQAVTFASMYGWSNDLFFAPVNPGILLYDSSGNPIQGDVSSQIKLWDNGTRVNQIPGSGVGHPGVPESKSISQISGTDAQGNNYLSASLLMKATLVYNGNSSFTITLQNTSGGTANQTPFSPGVWAVSYIVGGNLLNTNPLYTSGQFTANGLTNLCEAGDNIDLSTYILSNSGIFTPLSPILVVIYNGIANPIYTIGQNDAGKGLTALAQKGDASTLQAALLQTPGVKNAYILSAVGTKILLPKINGTTGSSVSQAISVVMGDRIAIATMYGFSNDWFFASIGNGVDATVKGDVSSNIALYDDGTAMDQFPGAGIGQFNLAGMPSVTNTKISVVPNPNAFTTLPSISNMVNVTIK